jgi:Na+/H+ antiporter NhaD/arsenite permease-like protein
MNFVTAPLIADLFLLAILAIGRKEVHDGTLGANSISPIEIIAFLVTLAYIAFSIDASGLIRYLAFKVLQKGGKVGYRLFFYLYAFFFSLGTFIGNYPIILSGTAFVAYMTRASSNIIHPRAWIHTQFAVANIASAILVSSNPTNLVLAGAFQIKFFEYTVNMIVPVVVTAIVLFPFLLYIVFADESLIPFSIKMHQLSEEAIKMRPMNPNIPHARGLMEEQENQLANNEQRELLSLDEIMNPFLDKRGAAFGAVIMAATLVTLLALNAASQSTSEYPLYWVTLPAAFVMFCWDIAFGWYRRKETRGIARKGLEEIELARAERAIREEGARRTAPEQERRDAGALLSPNPAVVVSENVDDLILSSSPPSREMENEKQEVDEENQEVDEEKQEMERREQLSREMALRPRRQTTLVSLLIVFYSWCQETFPTLTAVVTDLPFALVPFALSMFVLVQALVTKGWVLVFAYGWDHWVNKTGTVGAVTGMGFLSVILCNVSFNFPHS